MDIMSTEMSRRTMVKLAAGALCAGGSLTAAAEEQQAGAEDALDVWQRETDLVSAGTYGKYRQDGNTRSLASLEKLEKSFEKVFREAREVKVEDKPAVWSVYNMGYVVKTREALFSIDLVHRRAPELAPYLDFELVTHNHADHFHPELYHAMDGAGKTVISNFLDNYGVRNWKKDGGYTRAVKTFTHVPHRPQRLPHRLHHGVRDPRGRLHPLPHGRQRARNGTQTRHGVGEARPLAVLPRLRH